MNKHEKQAAALLTLAGFTPEMVEMAIYGNSRSPEEKNRYRPGFQGMHTMYPGAMIRQCAQIAEPLIDAGRPGNTPHSEIGVKYLTGPFFRLRDDLQLVYEAEFFKAFDKEKQYPLSLYSGTFNGQPVFISFEKGRECAGGYVGICTVSHAQSFELVNYLVKYYDFKDLDPFYNGLGGVCWSTMNKQFPQLITKYLQVVS